MSSLLTWRESWILMKLPFDGAAFNLTRNNSFHLVKFYCNEFYPAIAAELQDQYNDYFMRFKNLKRPSHSNAKRTEQ